MSESEPQEKMVIYDRNVMASKHVAFSRSFVVYYDGCETIQRKVESKMGQFVHTFQPNHVTTLEQSERNLYLVGMEPGMHILKKDISGAPSRELVLKLRDKFLGKDDTDEKRGIFDTIKDTISPSKTKKKGKKK